MPGRLAAGEAARLQWCFSPGVSTQRRQDQALHSSTSAVVVLARTGCQAIKAEDKENEAILVVPVVAAFHLAFFVLYWPMTKRK